MADMRKIRLSQHKQNRLLEHFGADTTTRCAALKILVFGFLKRKGKAYPKG